MRAGRRLAGGWQRVRGAAHGVPDLDAPPRLVRSDVLAHKRQVLAQDALHLLADLGQVTLG